MYLVDTNLVSEMFRPHPDPGVVAWLGSTSRQSLFLSSIVMAELYAGAALMPPGRRRASLTAMIDDFIDSGGTGNILAFGPEEAVAYADVVAMRSRSGRPIKALDAQIAATALVRGFAVVTRNVRDFEVGRVKVINPWELQ